MRRCLGACICASLLRRVERLVPDNVFPCKSRHRSIPQTAFPAVRALWRGWKTANPPRRRPQTRIQARIASPNTRDIVCQHKHWDTQPLHICRKTCVDTIAGAQTARYGVCRHKHVACVDRKRWYQVGELLVIVAMLSLLEGHSIAVAFRCRELRL